MKTIVGSTLTLWAFSLLVSLAAQAQGLTKVGVVLNFAADGGLLKYPEVTIGGSGL